MNRIILVFLLFLILAVNSYSKELEKVSLQLQWKHQFQFAGYYIAKEKGFFEEVGLDVTLKEKSYGVNVSNEVVEGNSQYGVGRSTLIIERSQGAKLVLIAPILQTSPIVFFTLKSSGIKRVQDLRNKKVVIGKNETATVTLAAMVHSQGLKFEDMKIQENSYDFNLLLSRQVDVMPGYTTDRIYQLEKKGKEYNIFHPKDYGFDFYEEILFTSEEELINHPDRVGRFKEASLKGWEYALSNIEESVELILEKYNTQNKTKEELLFEGKEFYKLAYYNSDIVGDIDLNKVRRTHDVYNLLGFIKNKVDVGDFIYEKGNEKELLFTQEEKNYLKEKAKIKMCVDPSWMPYEQLKNGQHIGITADYYEIISRNINKEFYIVRTKDWTQSLEFVKKRKCDILSLAMETPKRKKYLNFTSSYLKIPLVLATKSNMPFVGSIQSIDSDKKIGIPKNYAFNELIKKKYPHFNIVDVENIDDGLTKVQQGKLFGYIGTLSSIGYLFQKKFTGELQISGKFDEKWELGVGVRNDEPLLLDIMEKAINSIKENEHNGILNKWIAIKYEKGVDYTLIYQVLGVTAILLLFFFISNIRLKKRVKIEIEKNRQREQILIQQSKMAAMGEMMESIAHQWRQPLNGISLEKDLIVEQYQQGFLNDQVIEDYSVKTSQLLRYMSKTIDDFRDFFKTSKEKVEFNVCKSIRESSGIIKAKIKNNFIEFVEKDCKHDIYIKGYPNEFKQAIVNIISNGVDVILEKEIKNGKITLGIEIDDEFVAITIQDNGGGIPSDILKKVFDPYFTTKFQSQGTGLGLFMAKSIIEKNMDGLLTAENKDDGALFKIKFRRENT
ncbi:MAG: ABC transporter substrate-binding protein [Campylobacterales bacterium]|nr:ABC transporter substrate-binding protein [Campylobacterales bacterium]